MADVTNVVDVTASSGLPGMRQYTVVASDAETFTPVGFSDVSSCSLTYNEDPGSNAALGYTLSGNTITIFANGVTDAAVLVTVYGVSK